ncbi:uncharacterized protein B0P05DRAFT_546779 [Gilbertella persicaria]|uniref:uncharacterized protein n=1 Tax=Gilbertella persicaria TaxID=101096 RepID=UPI00221EA357|nr:uncharacterized protein B0P05DRAFT_546779 [Gilbertella persicaria]KAI8075883.1 hypothetical protein B0P05DRAFT_546779 [Gilbertella persicaria]
MVSAKTFIASSIAVAASFITVEAAVAPTYPSPGTIQTSGQAYDITWTFDGKNASAKYQIDFMTGSNDNQTVLYNVAKGVDPSLLKYSFVAPQVDPNSAIYFFMFTGDNGEYAWTTRFGIVAAAGQNLTAEPKQKQPNGDAIPWGNGKLAANATTAASVSGVVSSSAVAAASSSVVPVASSSAADAAATTTVATADSAVAAAAVAAASSSAPAVAQVAAKSNTSGVSMLKPALTLVSGLAAVYFAL